MIPFGRTGPMRPEQAPQHFHVYTYASSITTSRGREEPTERVKIADTRCLLAKAKPEEQERFNQVGKVVSHAIVQRGAPIAKENDELVLLKNGNECRAFRVQAVHNKGELDIHTVYYCEERSDLG